MSNRSWFYASNGQQQGPYPEAQLRDLITRGTVRADTLVWTEGMSGWQRAGEIPGLVPGGSAPSLCPVPPVAPAGRWLCRRLRRRCAVDRRWHLGVARAQPGVRHRHGAGDPGAVGCDLVLSLDRFPAVRSGPAEPRLHRPAARHLVRLHRDRRSDLCWRGRPLLPAISLDPDSGRAVLDGHSLDRCQPAARTASRLPIAFDGSALGYVGWQVLLYVSVHHHHRLGLGDHGLDALDLPQHRRHAARSHLHRPADWKCCGEPSCS